MKLKPVGATTLSGGNSCVTHLPIVVDAGDEAVEVKQVEGGAQGVA